MPVTKFLKTLASTYRYIHFSRLCLQSALGQRCEFLSIILKEINLGHFVWPSPCDAAKAVKESDKEH